MIRRFLFFDIAISGHHSEYISHVIDYIVSDKRSDYYTFIVHPEFSKRFPKIIHKARSSTNIGFIVISNTELGKAQKGGTVRKSLNNYQLMNKYAKAYSITNVCLLYFNTFQFALGVFRPNYEITGILFLQFSRMQKITLEERLKYIRKYWQTWAFVQNKQIKRIFILNDPKTVIYLNKEFKTNIFRMLPDPVPELTPMPDFSARGKYNIGTERKILLHFGSLSERKGTIDILDAYYHLKKTEIQKIALLLIGKADSNTDDSIKKRIEAIEKKYSESFIVYKNEFVPNAMMKSFFDQCDIVLIPYKNVEASSGIIGHAIASNKTIIGTKNGLLGSLIIENNLGIAIEDSSPKSISLGIQTVLDKSVTRLNNSNYLHAHSKVKFAEILINS